MKTLSEMLNESKTNNASCEIKWSTKEIVGQLKGTETVDQIAELINKALGKFKETLTDGKGFYMLILTDKDSQTDIYKPSLYIGLAYKQSMEIRPGQVSGHQAAYQCVIKNSKDKVLFIKLGVLTKCNLDKKTEQLYEDIEKCLIYCNQPTCNTLNKSNYESNRIVKIQNTGYFVSLIENCDCSKK